VADERRQQDVPAGQEGENEPNEGVLSPHAHKKRGEDPISNIYFGNMLGRITARPPAPAVPVDEASLRRFGNLRGQFNRGKASELQQVYATLGEKIGDETDGWTLSQHLAGSPAPASQDRAWRPPFISHRPPRP